MDIDEALKLKIELVNRFDDLYPNITIGNPLIKNKLYSDNNIKSAVLSFVERLSSYGGSKYIRVVGKTSCVGSRPVSFVERCTVLCPESINYHHIFG